MSKNYILLAISTVLMVTSCVQKTKKHVVTLFLDVSALKDIKNVGVRGENKPFSWNEDVAMEVVKKDSLYKTMFTMETGRLCTEIKFTVNGEFEFQDKENRKVYFDQSA